MISDRQFVKLTRKHGRPLYVNLSQVQTIAVTHAGDTVVFMAATPDPYIVAETPEQVLGLATPDVSDLAALCDEFERKS